jgi:hypothetical protein
MAFRFQPNVKEHGWKKGLLEVIRREFARE